MTATGRTTAAHLEHVEAPGSMLTTTAASSGGLGRWWAKLPFVQRHRWLI